MQSDNDRFYSGSDKYDLSKIVNLHNDILTEKDISLIKNYIAWLQATKHITDVRARKIAYTLVGWRRFIETPYFHLKIDDVYTGIANMKNGTSSSKSRKGEPLAANTQRDFIKILKPFLLWLVDQKIVKIPVSKIEKDIKPTKGEPYVITASDLLTVEIVLSVRFSPIVTAILTERFLVSAVTVLH